MCVCVCGCVGMWVYVCVCVGGPLLLAINTCTVCVCYVMSYMMYYRALRWCCPEKSGLRKETVF